MELKVGRHYLVTPGQQKEIRTNGGVPLPARIKCVKEDECYYHFTVDGESRTYEWAKDAIQRKTGRAYYIEPAGCKYNKKSPRPKGG